MAEVMETMNQAINAAPVKSGKYLTFTLAKEEYGVGILKDTGYILGMAKTGGGVKILLDIDKVLSTDEISALEITI